VIVGVCTGESECVRERAKTLLKSELKNILVNKHFPFNTKTTEFPACISMLNECLCVLFMLYMYVVGFHLQGVALILGC
jgi:hypothetical protein